MPVPQVPCVLMRLDSSLPTAFLRFLLTITIACACSPALGAPTTVDGSILVKIVDEHGKPARNAHVEVLGTRWMNTADSTGVIILNKVSPGTYSLLAARDDGGRAVKTGIHVTSDTTTIVEVTLKSIPTPIFNGTYWPCDSPAESDWNGGTSVQVGVGSEIHADTCMYAYRVLNRSRRTLTEVRIGYNGNCELTGEDSHAVPDTAFGPPGWICIPVQNKIRHKSHYVTDEMLHRDSTTFALSWRIVPGVGAGIRPKSSVSGFKIVLRKPDPLYSTCHWFAWADSSEDFSGSLEPAHKLDTVRMATGEIIGRITDLAGSPVAGATVQLWNAGRDTFSTAEGAYVITAVPVGKYLAIANTRGYGRCLKTNVRVTAGQRTRVDFHISTGALVIPLSAYTTALDRIGKPFPGPGIDTRRARIASHEIEIVYPGIGQDTTARGFVATVRRDFKNPAEEKLLRIAEETYPPTKAVAALAEDGVGKSLLKEKRLWWCGSYGAVRVPYAVTMDAVRYYLGLTQAMAKKSVNPDKNRSKFNYSASISPGLETVSMEGHVYRDVFAVKLRLEWLSTGSLVAFNLDRTVLLRPDGTVVGIFGDRRPDVMVS